MPLLSIQDLKKELNIKSDLTIRKLRKQGMPCINVSGVLRFNLEEVIRWLREQEHTADFQ